MGMTQSKYDPALFTKFENGKFGGAVVVHVDDIYAAGEKAVLDNIWTTLSKGLKMSKSRLLDTYISLKVEQVKDGSVNLSQKHYIHQIAKKHLPEDFKPASVPCNTRFSKLSCDPDSPVTSKPYSELIGMLQWVSNGTCPDMQ